MDVRATAIPDVLLLVPKRHGDARGSLAETYNRLTFADAGIETDFVLDLHTSSAERGTVRGLHFQLPPSAQAKLVRVVRGRIFDVAVDVRRGSPSFGRHVAVELSAEIGEQLYLPVGFAHGFATLEPDTEVVYKLSSFYAPDCERGIRWDDPDLAIAWPVAEDAAVVSERDRTLPRLRDATDLFA